MTTLQQSSKNLAARLLENRKLIIATVNKFVAELGGDIEVVVKATESMNKDMGKSIKTDNDMLEFLAAFDKFRTFFTREDTKTKLYQHLLELNVDAVDSRQIKSEFIAIIKLIIGKVELLGHTESIKEFVKGLNQIIASVDKYTDKLKHVQETIKSGGTELDDINELFSASASHINTSTILTSINKLATATKKLTFFKDIAIFRSNLNQVSGELVKYSESYPEMVGKTIGDAVSKIKSDYTELINQINDNKSGIGL